MSDNESPKVPEPPKVPFEDRYPGFPQDPEIEEPYRRAYRALEALPLGGACESEAGLGHVAEVILGFRTILREAELAAAAELGPAIGWYGDWPERDSWQLVLAGLDLPDDRCRDFGAGLSNQREGEWTDGPLSQAATAYYRQSRGDFPPRKVGLWLVMLARVQAVAAPPNPKNWPRFLSGNLVGFAIMYDPPEPEGVSHIWTARAWRRRGIASRLLDEARNRGWSDRLQGPFTSDGAALRRAREGKSG